MDLKDEIRLRMTYERSHFLARIFVVLSKHDIEFMRRTSFTHAKLGPRIFKWSKRAEARHPARGLGEVYDFFRRDENYLKSEGNQALICP